jgi:hypothetical protein
MVIHTCDHSYVRGISKRTVVWGQPRKIAKPYLKNNLKHKVLKVWLSVNTLCLASARPWVQISVKERKKGDKKIHQHTSYPGR